MESRNETVYAVVRGDTLRTIAQTLFISLGQKLVIPKQGRVPNLNFTLLLSPARRC
jgi:hypothetical protein